ncbi:MAG TPA: YcaO-like family protein [Nitrososphaeraceae archaeon]|nr:YcaO-like family protein [Nitrososphaeraceae archaeon]
MSSSSSQIRLNSLKKYTTNEGIPSARVRSVNETLEHVTPLCKMIGVTRVCDITYLDKLYIPNYSAVLPGTEDLFWVYSGKGTTNSHAKASALMESIERYCALSSKGTRTPIRGTHTELSKSYSKVLHPDEVVEPTRSDYKVNESIIDFLPGFDLLNREEVLVPAELVFSRYSTKFPSINAFLYSHTNGLASGNVIEEAICQALCEVIERDAVSIADLCASSIPYSILERITNSIRKMENKNSEFTQINGDDFVDDPSIFADTNISEITRDFKPLKFLVDRFTNAGINLLVKNITQKDIGIPTFVASSIEWITSDYGYFAIGYGTHLDSRIALVRAITELSQTRALNIQGARDDLKKIQYRQNDEIYKRKWQFMPAIPLTRKNDEKVVMFSEISTYINDDILDDIKFILNRLKNAGLKRAIIIDLTQSKIGIPVVRAIVPGLETLEVGRLYTQSELLMGRRAKSHFKNLLGS